MRRSLLILCLLILSTARVFSADVQLFPFLKIYPNPASAELTISNDRPIRKVVIVNMMGQVVFQQTYENVSSIQINIASYPPGMYYAQMDNAVAKCFVKE